MKRLFLCLALLLAGLTACAPSAVVSEGQVWAYDTLCSGKVWGDRSYTAVFESAAEEGQTLLSSDGSKEYTASAAGDRLSVGTDLFRILSLAEILYEKTGGVFDLTVAPLSRLWNVNKADTPPSAEEIEAALALVGWDKVSLSDSALTFSLQGMGIDIGSVGKGYGADRTVSALKDAGASAGVVSFGGNVALFGQKNGSHFLVGIRDPQSAEGGILGTLSVTDVSVVTTGAYERFFEYEGEVYHHLLDAVTGYPRRSDLLSVTVVCADGAQADLMATALWLMGSQAGWALYEELCQTEGFVPCDVIFVLENGSLWVSEGLEDSFSLSAAGYRREAP